MNKSPCGTASRLLVCRRWNPLSLKVTWRRNQEEYYKSEVSCHCQSTERRNTFISTSRKIAQKTRSQAVARTAGLAAPLGVMWRHWSRDHLIACKCKPFPIGGPLEPSLYLKQLTKYSTSNVTQWLVDMTLIRPLNKVKVIHFCTNPFLIYDFIQAVNSNFCSRTHRLATMHVHNVTDRQTQHCIA